MSSLPPGVYSVRAEANGFKSVERRDIQVEVATDVTVEFALSPGDVKETIVVTSEVPLVNTTSSTLGGTLSNKEINDLPLNGRNYENLLQLRPGVVRYPGGGFSTTSANGLRAEDNAYLVDGLFNSEPFSGSKHYQWRRHRGRLGDHPARRRDPGVQRSAESARRIRMEAGRDHERGLEVGHQQPSRNRIRIRSRHATRRAQLLQSGWTREKSRATWNSSAERPAVRSSKTSCSSLAGMKDSATRSETPARCKPTTRFRWAHVSTRAIQVTANTPKLETVLTASLTRSPTCTPVLSRVHSERCQRYQPQDRRMHLYTA